ncbi:cytoplasmic phosphatidylinositol transfer protein 1-like [Mizuhopecten yessoensis]|uniref:cytoplasmic phosphatidylinositol transfer protein 1-like n=1 Tax=Mizuhopecten yessoensis TaxID=6573 RepID=UPI000B45DF1A|nr:cytoplasmic phosphatidylinositol transfer protein 1-like [Mizuhopecten yessoensis]
MYLKEYRVCMPLSVKEYQIGQLYMIAKHSHEQSENGEGVEVVTNEPCEHEKHGKGQFTEKRIHLSNRLPTWIRSLIPRIFYITEKAWNYYPYTITEYTCSFMPLFSIYIETKYKDDNGCSENVFSIHVVFCVVGVITCLQVFCVVRVITCLQVFCIVFCEVLV